MKKIISKTAFTKVISISEVLFTCLLTLTIFETSTFAAEGKVQTSATGLNFSTGGIGEDEVQTMRRLANQFSLNIVFSAGAGSAATNVNATIFNETGTTVFRIKGANPLLYVDLPVGKYRVLANYQGSKQGYAFNVSGEKNQKLILNWPDEIEDDSKDIETIK